MDSTGLPLARVRVARPTDRLEEVCRFYEDGLGLARIGSFEGHAGYSGVMLGLPDEHVHLEFTHHEDGSPCPAPTRDNLLVLYLSDRGAVEAIATRLHGLGLDPVEPENPWWSDDLTFEDPGGWRIVLTALDS